MAVGEDVRLDDHLLAQGAFGGKAPAVDLRRDRLDGDPFSTWAPLPEGSSRAKRR
jgi:hypothetical protein